jgi:hypothetical protein
MDAEESTELLDKSNLLHRENSILSAVGFEGGKATSKPDHDSKYRLPLTWQGILLLSSIPVLMMPIIIFFHSLSSRPPLGLPTNPDSPLAIQLGGLLVWIL